MRIRSCSLPVSTSSSCVSLRASLRLSLIFSFSLVPLLAAHDYVRWLTYSALLQLTSLSSVAAERQMTTTRRDVTTGHRAGLTGRPVHGAGRACWLITAAARRQIVTTITRRDRWRPPTTSLRPALVAVQLSRCDDSICRQPGILERTIQQHLLQPAAQDHTYPLIDYYI